MRAWLIVAVLAAGCNPFDGSAPDAPNTAEDAPNTADLCDGPAPTGQGVCDCTVTGWRCNSCGEFVPSGGRTCEPGYTCDYEDWEHGCSCACNAEGRLACSGDSIGSICPTGEVSEPVPQGAIEHVNTDTDDEFAPTISSDTLELVYVAGAELWSSTRTSTFDDFTAGARRDDLSTAGDERDPELSADGLALLFVRDDSIVIATRASTTSAWSSASAVAELAGFGAPALGANDLHLVVVKDGALYEAARTSTTATWSTPIAIAELADPADDGGPTLSRGGLELMFHSNRGGTYQLWHAQRPALDQPFTPPTPLDLGLATANVRDPDLSRDGLQLYYTADVGGTQDLYLATRTAL